MKASILSLGITLLLSAPSTFADAEPGHRQGPCFRVTVQNQAENESRGNQSCDWNFNRTVQSGGKNVAETIQRGHINDNKVRQYRYDRSAYFAHKRGQ